MAQKSSKGNHGTRDQGSAGRGDQKATTGSAVSPEVAEEQRKAIEGDMPQGGAEQDGATPR